MHAFAFMVYCFCDLFAIFVYTSYIYLNYQHRYFNFTAIDLLRKYCDEFLENLPANCLITLENFIEIDIALYNEIFNKFISSSSSQECNKEILYFLIESTENDNRLLGFSYIMQLLTESRAAVLFRDGGC